MSRDCGSDLVAIKTTHIVYNAGFKLTNETVVLTRRDWLLAFNHLLSNFIHRLYMLIKKHG
jgi:hypothetical protein